MHIIEHYGSGMRRMKKDCDENGSPYPAMKSGNGEFRITFSARTKESVAKLGIPPEKFGIADDAEEVAKKRKRLLKRRKLRKVRRQWQKVSRQGQKVSRQGRKVRRE